jgi:hypothetical protein
VDECLPWLTARSNLYVVNLVRNVSSDGDRVPSTGFIRIGDVGTVERAVSHIDQAIGCKPDGDCGLSEVVDVSGADRHQTVEVGRGGASFELEVQRVDGRLRRLAAQPTVARADIGARPRTERGAVASEVSRPDSGCPWSTADLSARTGAGKYRNTEQ